MGFKNLSKGFIKPYREATWILVRRPFRGYYRRCSAPSLASDSGFELPVIWAPGPKARAQKRRPRGRLVTIIVTGVRGRMAPKNGAPVEIWPLPQDRLSYP